MRLYGRDAFAAERRGDQTEMEKNLFPIVSEAIDRFPAQGWYDDLLREAARLYVDTYHREGGKGQPQPPASDFVADLRDTLDKTENPTDATPERISTWLTTAILNAGTQAAAASDEEFVVLEWVTMHDEDVRPEHRATDGQTRPPGEPYDVDGVPMRYPGDPTAPIELWINCRCTLAPTLGEEAESFATGGTTMTDTATEPLTEPAIEPTDTTVPWHGVLAPEGSWSGDGRRFLPNSLTHRDLPMPLGWQKFTQPGHDDSVVVATIETIDRVGTEVRGAGHFLSTPEADEVIGLIAEFGRFGISVDADNAEWAYEDEDTNRHSYSAARISAASIVAIPAFAESYITLGDWESSAQSDTDQEFSPTEVEVFVSDKPWSDFTAADYTDDQWYSACCLHKNGSSRAKSDNGLPVKEPGGALNRNGVHSAAARFNQVSAPDAAKSAAKACLRGAYKQLGEEPPDVLAASLDETSPDLVEAGRGPGWVTDPVATRRIWAYWTQKGQPGYAKINWGVPGDFNRCRTLVGEKIAANSPEDTRFLNQICAQWHHDALGIWPGRPVAADTEKFGTEMAPALTLVASAVPKPPLDWFLDPCFTAKTPLTVTEEGRVFGHVAEWGTCHTGYDGVCTEPPHSPSGYAYFRTGEVLTTDGPVPVGCLTLGGGHAADGLRPRPALAHYDDVSTAWCDVACGEDDYGIWVAGYVRPGTPEEMVVAARASKPSGDWRRIGGALEMIAVHQVNTPGFPVPRVAVANGVQIALVAAGAVHTDEPRPPTLEATTEELAEMVAVALRNIERRRERMKALVARVHGEVGQ